LNTGYLVTASLQEFPDEPDAPRLVLEQEGVYVYERPTALPRAWVVPQVEVVDAGATLARIHEPGFDPRATALVESAVTCGGTVAGSPGQVEMVRDEGNRIETQVQGGGGLLVFSEVYYPGWRAMVDGNPAQLVRADYVLRALCVPAGEHRIEMVYDPPSLKVGLAITGPALAIVLCLSLWSLCLRGKGKGRVTQ
jgi:hypothetical protein